MVPDEEVGGTETTVRPQTDASCNKDRWRERCPNLQWLSAFSALALPVCPLYSASFRAFDFQSIFYLEVKHKVSALGLDAPLAESTSSPRNFLSRFLITLMIERSTGERRACMDVKSSAPFSSQHSPASEAAERGPLPCKHGKLMDLFFKI